MSVSSMETREKIDQPPSTPTELRPPKISTHSASSSNASASSTEAASKVQSGQHVTASMSTQSIKALGKVNDTCPLGATTGPSLIVRGLTKRESYKDRKKNYQRQKKKVAEELLSTLADPAVVVLADWLKVRGMLKGWTKLWCEVKPGLVVLYKSPKTHKSGQWAGTVLLNVVEVIERPSKKDGFCFKLFNPLDQSIWASRGPKGESFGAIMQPLPIAYLIFRAPSEEAGKTWMEAIELSLRCSSLMVRTMSSGPSGLNAGADGTAGEYGSGGHSPTSLIFPSDPHVERMTGRSHSNDEGSPSPLGNDRESNLNDSDMERHFKDHDLDDDDTHTDHEDTQQLHSSESESDAGEQHSIESQVCGQQPLHNVPRVKVSRRLRRSTESEESDANRVIETAYVESVVPEEFGLQGDEGQTEEVADENKSLLWSLLKQVRPGMDLSKVVLPTFILEPRSFLEKLTDYYFHCDILSKAVLEDDPLTRMKLVVKWYLSGFYKKPKGLKKPYNPILGETFRCCWVHPETDSRTFYLAEQVSHHPPVSAFYVTNRKDGFTVSGSILAKSKFYGNSVSAILDGTAKLTMLSRGEDYTIAMPYAHCKGILMGTMTLEMGGKVNIFCEKTGYSTDLEFKLKPFLGGSDICNLVTGKIRLAKETLATVEGHWDTEITVKDKKTGQSAILWSAGPEIRAGRLKRCCVPLECQHEFESESLWRHVTAAISRGDQIAATEEKTILEEGQRQTTKERAAKLEAWTARNFVLDMATGDWIYKYSDSRPWDPRTDVLQYERDFIIQSKTRHGSVPLGSNARAGSVISIEPPMATKDEFMLRRVGSTTHYAMHSTRREMTRHSSDTTDQDGSDDHVKQTNVTSAPDSRNSQLMKRLVEPIAQMRSDMNSTFLELKTTVDGLAQQQAKLVEAVGRSQRSSGNSNQTMTVLNIAIVVIVSVICQLALNWWWTRHQVRR